MQSDTYTPASLNELRGLLILERRLKAKRERVEQWNSLCADQDDDATERQDR